MTYDDNFFKNGWMFVIVGKWQILCKRWDLWRKKNLESFTESDFRVSLIVALWWYIKIV